MTVPDGWMTEDFTDRNERHLLPNDEIRLSIHVASKLCFCSPKKTIHDVTLYSHRNVTRADASNERILKKKVEKKVSERLRVEVQRELSASQVADAVILSAMGLHTVEDVSIALEKMDETADILRRYLALNS
jgi:hypothetical protein